MSSTAATSTARVIANLELYGHTPAFDELEHRPMPDVSELSAVAASLFAALTTPLADTALEPDLPDLAWSLVDIVHRKLDRLQRVLDDNESRQRAAQGEQDGSEVRSVELERLIARGQLLVAKREAFECLRDQAAAEYEQFTGLAWRPRTGSMVNRKAMTATLIDSRDFISAKRRSETEVLLPPGPKIIFAGGTDCNDVDRIWARLDQALAKHPEMVLLHGGNARGAERIAACWADTRKVVQIAFRPGWTDRSDKSAPFKRNDRMLDALPIGVIIFPGNGITENIATKAKARGIPVLRG